MAMQATKANFMSQYRYHLTTHYDWTLDTAKFERFMDGVRSTLYASRSTWTPSGKAYTMTLDDLGLKHSISMTKLRALPE